MFRYERVSLLQRVGFITRAEFHQKSREAANNLRIIKGKWFWAHNSEEYATNKFQSALENIESNTPLQHTNVPAGYTPETWTVDDEMAKERRGIVTNLLANGDWTTK